MGTLRLGSDFDQPGPGGEEINRLADLGVNIDHVATIREARKTNEPDPVWAATLAELGGGIYRIAIYAS